MNKCWNCKHHVVYYDEDGTDDGCVCRNEDDEYHLHCCSELWNDKENCPYWKDYDE